MNENKNQLVEGYYLTNFLSLLGFVRKGYEDILTEQEKLFIKNFRSLPRDAARLYVRLISRSKPLFRIDTLNYKEIKNPTLAAKQLARAGFLVMDGDYEIESLLDLFTKPELIEFLKSKGKKTLSSWSRSATTAEIEGPFSNEFFQWVKDGHTTLLPLGQEMVELFRLLFFGNLEQTLSEFILEDIGVMRFEKYRLTKSLRYFQTRKDVEETYQMIDLQVELYFAREEKELELVENLMKKVQKLKSERLLRKREKLNLMAGQFFEKNKDFKKALFYYKRSSLPPSRERRVRVLDKLGETQKALKLCQIIGKDFFGDSEKEFISHYPSKLKRKLGIEFEKVERESFETESAKIRNQRGERVELCSLAHLEAQGFKGFYVENYLWTSLFGLIFWEIIFKSKAGAFFNQFQRGPNDLFTEDFYLSRKSEIDKRIAWIGNKDWDQEVINTFEKKELTANHLVRWRHVKKSEIRKVLKKIPAQHIRVIMQRMCRDLRQNSSGFPDLFVYEPRKKGYCLVEVKGPGDQLQQSQKRWLRYFNENEIPCKILKVSYS